MAKWNIAVLALALSYLPLHAGPKARSANFEVEAPTRELAEEFAKLAEKYRREKALEWLGKEMPTWSAPCPLRVVPAQTGAEGATTFNFDQNTREMVIKGSVERMKNSVLPHEVTHTVLAHHFRRPVPRWADEGGSVYSEDDVERRRHDKMSVQYLNAGRAFTLKALFTMRDYPPQPSEMMILYAEGYSISKYLIERADRATFVNFVGEGMNNGWDSACRKFYEVKSVDALEAEWLDHLRRSARGDDAAAAAPRRPAEARFAANEAKPAVRQSGSSVQPLLDPLPVARGAFPESDRRSAGNRDWDDMPQRFFDTAPAQYPSDSAAKTPGVPTGRAKGQSPALPPPAELLPPIRD